MRHFQRNRNRNRYFASENRKTIHNLMLRLMHVVEATRLLRGLTFWGEWRQHGSNDATNHVFNQLINGRIDSIRKWFQLTDFVIDKRESNYVSWMELDIFGKCAFKISTPFRFLFEFNENKHIHFSSIETFMIKESRQRTRKKVPAT